jgi:hypothetical protein
VCDLETSRICTPYIYDISTLRVKTCVLEMKVQCVCCNVGTEIILGFFFGWGGGGGV